MLDNPFLLLVLMCGAPLATHGLAFALGWWMSGRGYRVTRRRVGNGRTAATPGVGYAASTGAAQHRPVADRIERLATQQ